MSKRAETDYPVHDLIASRWSPYGFSDRAVEDDDLRSLWEAARWAPSSYNEQPWSFIVATRDYPEEFDIALSCLLEANRDWARAAAAIAISVVALEFTRNGKPNAAAQHDMGLAVANLSFEATARGLSVHQMIGILPDRAREAYGIPDDHAALTGIAVGWPADVSGLAEKYRERDLAPRGRKPVRDFVFGGRWGETAGFVAG